MITKKTKPEDEIDFTAGEIILIDKEKGFTSFVEEENEDEKDKTTEE